MFAVIYLPDFALQSALRLEPALAHQPVALVDASLPRIPIIQLTAAARDEGVVAGLTATQARARCAEVIVKPRSAELEKAAAAALLQCAYEFSPDLEATADGTVTLDLKGFRGLALEPYARRMVEQARWLHLEAQVGVAANPLLALYAARRARPVLVVGEQMENGESDEHDRGAESAFLAELPIEAIEPSPEAHHVLRQWGIRTLGAFVALGEEALTERLGVEGRVLYERATVRHRRPLRLVRPEERYVEAVEFEHEVETAGPLLAALRRFVEQIAVRMGITGKVPETLALRLKFAGGPDYTHTFKVPEPTSHEETLFRMLHTHLERFQSPHAILGVQLSGQPCLARRRQFGLFESSLRNPNHFGQTLAQLAGLVGSERVGRPAPQPTHRADAFEMQPVAFEEPRGDAYRPARKEVRARGDARPPMGLPLRRFRPPLLAAVERADGRPTRFRARDGWSVIRQAQGPWRSSGDWWDSQRWSRDEWDVETADGSLYRLFEQDGDWFVEGIYD
jgi:protein ImuB